MAKIECLACKYEGKDTLATYLTILIGTDEKWGSCEIHYLSAVELDTRNKSKESVTK